MARQPAFLSLLRCWLPARALGTVLPLAGSKEPESLRLGFWSLQKWVFFLDHLLSDSAAQVSPDCIISSPGFSGQRYGICLAPAFLLPFLCWPSEDRCSCSDQVWSPSLKSLGTGFAVISLCFMVAAEKGIFIWKLPPLLIQRGGENPMILTNKTSRCKISTRIHM